MFVRVPREYLNFKGPFEMIKERSLKSSGDTDRKKDGKKKTIIVVLSFNIICSFCTRVS